MVPRRLTDRECNGRLRPLKYSGPSLILAAAFALACSGCAMSSSTSHRPPSSPALALALAGTRPPGRGRAFRPPAIGNPAVAAGRPVGALRCAQPRARPYGAHIELFADGWGMVVPAGIGIAPPQRREGPFVRGGRCLYPLRTVDPTGVVEIDRAASPTWPTVGQLFELWGEPLSPQRLGSFRAHPGARVVAFVDGRRWDRDPRAIPLRRHAQVVIELETQVQPHASYTFPPGL
jgi:hypothetical protein